MATHRCDSCGRPSLPATAFSKRQLLQSTKRCKVCVLTLEKAEQHAAGKKRDRVATDGSETAMVCSICSKLLPASSFSRTQRVQKTDANRRCLSCVGHSAPMGDASSSDSVLAVRVTSSEVPVAMVPWSGSSVPSAARPDVEVARLLSTRRLRRLLGSLCADAGAEPPIMALDRWMARSKLLEPPPHEEPLLPAAGVLDEGLVKDLCRGGALRTEQAHHIAVQLSEASMHAAKRLASGGGGRRGGTSTGCNEGAEQSAEIDAGVAHPSTSGRVVVHEHGHLLRLALSTAAKPYADISKEHFDKLVDMYAVHGTTSSSPGTPDLRTRAFCMLLRYQSLGAHGNQCALPPEGFDVLRDHLGVAFECFASPLNARYDRYCSAFADVDGPFGSVGSFFECNFTEGSFECNPPFVPEVMLAAIKRAEAFLSDAEDASRPLSFTFIVPSWDAVAYYRQLLNSRWLRGGGPLKLSAETHGFVDGAQHIKQKSDRLRVSSFGSTVGVLQTTAAASKWPVRPALYKALNEAWQSALPTASESKARMERGGNDAVSLLLKRRAAAEAVDESTVDEAKTGEAASRKHKSKKCQRTA